jgi:hypothetical protein
MSDLAEVQIDIGQSKAKIRVLESELQVDGISEAKEMLLHTRIAAAEQRLAGLEARILYLEQQTSAGRNKNVYVHLF